VAILSVAMKARGTEGEPLPSPFKAFDINRAFFRRGQMSLVAAASGRGKSALMTHWVVNAAYPDGSGIPSFYGSFDSDRMTLGSRVAAGILKKPVSDVEELLKDDRSELWQLVSNRTPHIWWSFKRNPSIGHIEDELEAYAHVYGSFPEMVVLDNLMNIDSGVGGQGWETHDNILAWGEELAALTGAHVCFTCHVKGYVGSGDVPIPMNGMMNNLEKRPRLIFTIYRDVDMTGVMQVDCVKNSTGPAPVHIELPWYPERSMFG